MTKNLLVTFLFLVAFGAAAQEMNFGIKGGVNFSNLHSSNTPLEEQVESITSFHVGALTEARFSKLFALELQALYSRQGTKATNMYTEIEPPGEVGLSGQVQQPTAANTYGEITGKYDYLNLPLLAKLYVYEGLNVFAGPQVSILVSAEDKEGAVTIDVSEDLDPMDFGILSGVGYQLDLGLFFSAAYYWGLNNISAYNYEPIFGFDPDIHQGVIQLSAGYKF